MTGKTETNERAVSEILGTILLISLVLLGSATVVVFGASVITDAQEQTRSEAAADYLQQVDSQLATLSASADEPDVQFDPQDAAAREYDIQRDGYLKVTVNPGSSSPCTVQQPLSTLEYEDSNGNTVGYEAGGVWRANTEGSSQLTPPDVTFTNGRLSVNLLNITGTFDQSRNRVRLNVTRTRNTTQTLTQDLLKDDCPRPDTVRIEVQSQFYRGWGAYLESETGESSTVNDATETVTVDIPQTSLHPSADDTRNQVINLSVSPTASYMDSVTRDEIEPPRLGVDKTAGNNYTTFVGPVTNDSLDIGREISVEGTNIPGPPLDVAVVLDESGSMQWDEDGNSCGGPCPTSKMDLAKQEAQNFMGYINESRDRASIHSYDSTAYHHITNDRYFSGDFDAVNGTVGGLTAGGGTRIDRGLDYSNSIFDLKGNESREKITILLTDGVNNGCDVADPTYWCVNNRRTLERAWQADNDSVTVYAIAFGSGADSELLEDVANATGGQNYTANNAGELADAFKNISERIQPKDAVANVPITTNVSDSTGAQFSPEIPGNVSHIANNSNGLLNVNDPTSPALFSHSFEIGDGQTFELNVTDYECRDGAYNLTGQTVSIGGNTRSVARCTDIVSSNQSFQGDIYTDGEPVPRLQDTTYEDWQTNITKALNSDRYPSTRIESGTLNTTSNQALVVYDLPPEAPPTPSRNTMALLVRIGLAESDAQGTGIVTVRVSEAEVD